MLRTNTLVTEPRNAARCYRAQVVEHRPVSQPHQAQRTAPEATPLAQTRATQTPTTTADRIFNALQRPTKAACLAALVAANIQVLAPALSAAFVAAHLAIQVLVAATIFGVCYLLAGAERVVQYAAFGALTGALIFAVSGVTPAGPFAVLGAFLGGGVGWGVCQIYEIAEFLVLCGGLFGAFAVLNILRTRDA